MSLTRPTEVVNNDNLKSNSPVLLIEFADLNYHIGSKEYYLEKDSGSDGELFQVNGYFVSATAQFLTDNVGPGDIINVDGVGDLEILEVIDGTQVDVGWTAASASFLDWTLKLNHRDLLKNKNSLSLNNAIPEKVNGYNSLNSINLVILDWRSTVSIAWTNSLTSLKGSAVNIYLKYDTGDAASTGALKIFSGVISGWEINRDVLTLSVDNLRKSVPELQTLLPESLIQDSIQSSNYLGGRPVQFGDFSWNDDFVYWADRPNKYAYIPYVYTDEADKLWFYVAEHAMKNMPTATQLNGDGDVETELYTFIFRHGMFWMQRLINATVTNAAGGSYIKAEMPTSGARPFMPPEAEYDGGDGLSGGNAYTEWANAVDGKSSTYVLVNAAGGSLQLCQITPKETLGEFWDNSTVLVSIRVHISVGAIVSAGDCKAYLYNRDAGTEIDSFTFSAGDANTTVLALSGSVPAGGSYDCLDNFVVSIEAGGTGQVVVKNIIVSIPLADADLTSERLYMRCQGLTFGDTWGGRKTSTNVVECPIDVVEYLLRNYVGVTAISTGLFNQLATFYASIKVAFTLVDQVEVQTIIKDLMEQFLFSLIIPETDDGNWRIVSPMASALVFSYGAGSTPGNGDIFNQDDSFSGSEFIQGPIDKNSLSVEQNNSDDIYGQFEIKSFEIEGIYYGLSTTGSGLRKTLENKYIRSQANADTLLALIDDWFLNQKLIIKFDSYWNAAFRQVGDVINIRHDDIIEDMLGGGSKNNQKYMIIRLQKKWRPHLIGIDAIEMK